MRWHKGLTWTLELRCFRISPVECVWCQTGLCLEAAGPGSAELDPDWSAFGLLLSDKHKCACQMFHGFIDRVCHCKHWQFRVCCSDRNPPNIYVCNEAHTWFDAPNIPTICRVWEILNNWSGFVVFSPKQPFFLLCFFTVFESHPNPTVPDGVGFSWPGAGALVDHGAGPPAGITNTHTAIWVQSSGGHVAAQGQTDKRVKKKCCCFFCACLLNVWRFVQFLHLVNRSTLYIAGSMMWNQLYWISWSPSWILNSFLLTEVNCIYCCKTARGKWNATSLCVWEIYSSVCLPKSVSLLEPAAYQSWKLKSKCLRTRCWRSWMKMRSLKSFVSQSGQIQGFCMWILPSNTHM